MGSSKIAYGKLSSVYKQRDYHSINNSSSRTCIMLGLTNSDVLTWSCNSHSSNCKCSTTVATGILHKILPMSVYKSIWENSYL